MTRRVGWVTGIVVGTVLFVALGAAAAGQFDRPGNVAVAVQPPAFEQRNAPPGPLNRQEVVSAAPFMAAAVGAVTLLVTLFSLLRARRAWAPEESRVAVPAVVDLREFGVSAQEAERVATSRIFSARD